MYSRTRFLFLIVNFCVYLQTFLLFLDYTVMYVLRLKDIFGFFFSSQPHFSPSWLELVFFSLSSSCYDKPSVTSFSLLVLLSASCSYICLWLLLSCFFKLLLSASCHSSWPFISALWHSFRPSASSLSILDLLSRLCYY